MRVVQGTIEQSNVRAVVEMARMIELTRTYTQIASLLQQASEHAPQRHRQARRSSGLSRTETSMRALHTAATGMMAQELNVQVISNNIANMRTTGYKRQRAEFQDLLYEHVSRVGTQTSTQGNILPVGIDLGGGVKTVGTPRIMTQGTLLPTGKDFDVAIRGDGFFKILHAGRHLRLYARRLVPDGRAGPHRHRQGQCRAARHHHPAELDLGRPSTRRARCRRPSPARPRRPCSASSR